MNIYGNLSKLESKSCLEYLNKFDVIVLLEVKCSYAFSVPGFEVLRSNNRGMRGGVAVLVKACLWPSVFDAQSRHDQVWFRLSFMSDVLIGACYIPPADSPYFSPASFSDIQDQVVDSDNRVIALGDLNSRMSSLHKLNDVAKGISYSTNVDQGEYSHGRELLNMCLNLDVFPVNHLNYNGRHFAGSKTFRRRDDWISQIDWLIVSSPLLHLVDDFIRCGRLIGGLDDAQKNSYTELPEYAKPSKAMQLGGELRQLALLKKGMSLEQRDANAAEDAEDFLALIDLYWNPRVTHMALKTRDAKKYDKVNVCR